MPLRPPVMDGSLATRELRRSPVCTELLVIALTSGALEAGMSDFLTKPLEPAVLVRAPRRHIERARRRAAGAALAAAAAG